MPHTTFFLPGLRERHHSIFQLSSLVNIAKPYWSEVCIISSQNNSSSLLPHIVTSQYGSRILSARHPRRNILCKTSCLQHHSHCSLRVCDYVYFFSRSAKCACSGDGHHVGCGLQWKWALHDHQCGRSVQDVDLSCQLSVMDVTEDWRENMDDGWGLSPSRPSCWWLVSVLFSLSQSQKAKAPTLPVLVATSMMTQQQRRGPSSRVHGTTKSHEGLCEGISAIV